MESRASSASIAAPSPLLWFSEPLRNGCQRSFPVDRVLEQFESKHNNDIFVFENASGKGIALNGFLRFMESASGVDEYRYTERNESIAWIPGAFWMYNHQANQAIRFLIIGGDGGCAHAVLAAYEKATVTLVEPDEEVIKVSAKHFKTFGSVFDKDNDRVTHIIKESAEYVKDSANHGQFDVVIVDLADPSHYLKDADFVKYVTQCAKEDGVTCHYSGVFPFEKEAVQTIMQCLIESYHPLCLLKARIWTPTGRGIILGGSQWEVPVEVERFQSRFMRMFTASGLRMSSLQPTSALSCFLDLPKEMPKMLKQASDVVGERELRKEVRKPYSTAPGWAGQFSPVPNRSSGKGSRSSIRSPLEGADQISGARRRSDAGHHPAEQASSLPEGLLPFAPDSPLGSLAVVGRRKRGQ